MQHYRINLTDISCLLFTLLQLHQSNVKFCAIATEHLLLLVIPMKSISLVSSDRKTQSLALTMIKQENGAFFCQQISLK